MNILIITDMYVPNANSSAVLMRDLAIDLKKRGHEVYVLSTMEHNINKEKHKELLEAEDGINVVRVKALKKKNVSFIKRGLGEVMLPYIMYYKSKKLLNNVKFDLIINYSPPVTLSILVEKYKRKNKCKNYLVLRDIFPQCAVDAGVLSNKHLINYFKALENKLYSLADYIGVQSEENYKYVLNNYDVNKEKIKVLYNWINLDIISKEKTWDFRKEFNINDHDIICLYAGNIGKYQELDFLLELAKINLNKKDLKFLIVGSGSEKEKLLKDYGNLENVIFKNFVSPGLYYDLVKSCNIGLVNLNRNLTIQNIPGKILGYWAEKLPILASINKDNDLAEILLKSKGGLYSYTGDIKSYDENLKRLYEDEKLRVLMGENGNKYLKEYYTSDIAAENILSLFKLEGKNEKNTYNN